MQLRSRIALFFTILFMGFISAIGLMVLELFGSAPVSFDVPIPAQATWVLRADAFSFIQREAYILLFESDDDELITSVQDMLKERTNRNGIDRPLNLDLRRDLILFGAREGQQEFMGILLQVNSPELFSENISYYLDNSQTVAVKGKTALILTALNKKGGLSKTKQQQLTNTFINGKQRHFERSQIPSEELLSLEISKAGVAGEAKNLKIGIEMHPHSVEIKGEFEAEQNDIPARSYTLKHTGLFVATSIMPKVLTDSVNSIVHHMSATSYQFSKLKSVTFDLQGVVLDPSMGYNPVPKMNMIIESHSAIQIDSILQSLPAHMIGENNTVRIAEMTYYLRLLDAHTLFIGLDPKSVIAEKQDEVSVIKGRPDALMKIGGSSLALGILEVFSIFKASKEFILSTEEVDFSITKQAGTNVCKLDGVVEFKPDVYPQHAITRLFLNGISKTPM